MRILITLVLGFVDRDVLDNLYILAMPGYGKVLTEILVVEDGGSAELLVPQKVMEMMSHFGQEYSIVSVCHCVLP